MSENRWKFAEVDPNEPAPEKIERGGMIVVLVIGSILLIGGLLMVWKIGAYSFEFFGNGAKYSLSNSARTERDILALLNLPWIAGAVMVIAAVKKIFTGKKDIH
jgi:hypothetical protein